MTTLSIDFETRSTVDLKKTGAYVYAAHPTTDIWCMAWAFDDDEPDIWVPRTEDGLRAALPPPVYEHIKKGGVVRAWNAAFERRIWHEIVSKRLGHLPLADEQLFCTMAEAAAMGIPLSLDKAAKVLGLKAGKDEEGYNLMLRMSRPRKVNADGSVIWWDVPERMQRLYAYCKQDVRVERLAVKALRRLPARERSIYLLDQRMNDRGICVDRALITAARALTVEGKARADDALERLTGGAVNSVTQSGRLVEWLRNQDVETISVAKPKVAELLEGTLSPEVREVLELRSELGRSSVAKLNSMEAYADENGVIRGLLQYHAAHTGRWGGRGPQPQNYPRGEVEDVEGLIPAVLTGDYDYVTLFAPPVPTVSSMLRSMLMAPPGYELISGDFSAVEARVLNWLAGETEILALFRAMDAGDPLKHPYKVMAVRMGRAASPADVKKPSEDYQAGKAAELGCGFGMGWEKFIDAAWKVYQVRVNEEQAKHAVEVYRNTHPNVVDFWYETERACMDAVNTPGQVFTFGARKNLRAVVAGRYLHIVLPSGKFLYYAAPKIVEAEPPWSKKARLQWDAARARVVDGRATPEDLVLTAKDKPEKQLKLSLEYSGTDTLSKQWGRLRTYGGHLVENIVQAAARDLMADAMLRLEARNFQPVLTVHDEVVGMVKHGEQRMPEFVACMAEVPEWATGCPVLVEGWQGRRYRK